MQYHFIKFKPTDLYSNIIDLNQKPRLICFNETIYAQRYIDYMTHFRRKHGYWLRIDLSDEKKEITSKELFKEKKHEKHEKFLEIERLDEDEFEMICSTYNLSLLYCHKFEVISEDNDNKFNLLLSAQELDSNINEENYIKMLNRLNR